MVIQNQKTEKKNIIIRGDIDKDDNPKIITYITEAEFQKKYDKYLSSGDKSVFDYFTIIINIITRFLVFKYKN